MDMNVIGVTLLVVGAFVVVIGAAILLGVRLPSGGLPGDISFQRGNFSFYFPIVGSIIASIVLTIVLNIALRIFK